MNKYKKKPSNQLRWLFSCEKNLKKQLYGKNKKSGKTDIYSGEKKFAG